MTAADGALEYKPDYASAPGDLVQECLAHLQISARELARRCGRSGKLMAEIVAGKAPVEPETSLQLERVLGIPASVWSNMEAAYQLHLARRHERTDLAASYGWAKAFPIKDLVERGHLSAPTDRIAAVEGLLTFFGVGSVKACEDRMQDLLHADFRTSLTFANSTQSLAAWLRIGEIAAVQSSAAPYDRDAFVAVLRNIRRLTAGDLGTALAQLTELCGQAGVVFLLEKPFAGMRASGVSRWLTPGRALIQQTLRHMSDDHFWFTFFHECAHLLLHGRKAIFIDADRVPGSADPKQEAEANAWASDFLIPGATLKTFLRTFRGTEAEVATLAAECGIADGIVVGQLQHRGVVRYNAMNHMKARYQWS